MRESMLPREIPSEPALARRWDSPHEEQALLGDHHAGHCARHSRPTDGAISGRRARRRCSSPLDRGHGNRKSYPQCANAERDPEHAHPPPPDGVRLLRETSGYARSLERDQVGSAVSAQHGAPAHNRMSSAGFPYVSQVRVRLDKRQPVRDGGHVHHHLDGPSRHDVLLAAENLAAAGHCSSRRLAQTFTEHPDGARNQQGNDHNPQGPLAHWFRMRIGHVDSALSHGWPLEEREIDKQTTQEGILITGVT